jgi:pimeloyl-ACP methyl ester carboxylesterase
MTSRTGSRKLRSNGDVGCRNGTRDRVSNWATAVFDAPEAFKDDFRCITMDQRNANGGESTGPIPADDPWGAFADDQLGLMDHLGIQKFFFMR